MEFSVSKADLVRELTLSQGVVEKRTTIPILSNVLLEATEDRLLLTATDLELGIRTVCPARVKRPGAGTIPARKLLDYVRLLPDAELHVRFAENQWASLVCGRSRTRIAGMSRDSFPELPPMPEPLAELPAWVLSSMIAKTIYAISTEESRFTLSGALLIFREGAAAMVSTDGHRLALVEQREGLAELRAHYRALIPRKAMAEILKLAQEAGPEATVQFSGDENHLFFRFGERLLISRKLAGNFPDFERVLPREHPRSLLLDREEARAAIERVSQFSDERSHAIRLRLAAGELRMHSSLSDTGESEESLPVEYDGGDFEIGFNAHYLLDFLRVLDEQRVWLHFKDAQSAGELRPAGEDAGYTYRYIVMPMKI
ncbi:MAG: DNA polymerase III subunit beta [Bryobacterales bacterium]|nr:DNA polymerase III subunit beta [Bryobacteraceae bacterium]MDW8353002.1 DNA polymerase III subunit beta [Bryobacterales bacterium]